MGSLVVDAFVVDVIMGPCMHSLVSLYTVNLVAVDIFLWMFLLWVCS